LFGAEEPTGPVRVATYKRASTDEGNQPYSLDAQQQRIDTFLPTHPEWTLVEQYEERASGKDVDGRPELLRLLAHAAAGRFDVVLVARLDRWTRSLFDLLDTVNELDDAGVSLTSCTEQFDTRTPIGRLLMHLLGMFAEFERSTIIDRIQRGNAAKLRRGLPLSARVGYGLTVDDSGIICSDPATIGVVKRIYREYGRRRTGFRAIADGLNTDAIPGPSGGLWSPQSFGNVLRNRAFIGELRHRDSWVPGAHRPVLDVELFEAAQRQLEARTANRAPTALRGEFVLTGVIRCGRCSGAYIGTSGTSRNQSKVRYYSCGTARRYGPKKCAGPNLPAEELEDLITESLLDSYRDNALFDEAITRHLAHQADAREPLEEELATVTATIAERTRILRRYQDDYEAGELSAARYESRSAELEEELVSLNARAADLEMQMRGFDLPAAPTETELGRMRQHLLTGVRSGVVRIRKALFAALVAGIEVHDRDDIRPTFRLYAPEAADYLHEPLPTP
jgi:site-specific DNA recombinase